MKILKVAGLLIYGLSVGCLVSLMQVVMFYVMFISAEPSHIPMLLRIVLFIIVEIIGLGFSIEIILKEIRDDEFRTKIRKLLR